MIVHGKGSVIRREDKPRNKCRVWELSLKTEAGRKTRAFHGSWSEAQEALEAFRAEVSGIVGGGLLLGRYLGEWHQKRVESGRFAYKTMRSEDWRVQMLADILGEVPLPSLDWKTIEDAYARLSGYSPGTLAVLNTTLNTALNHAVRDGLMASNPLKRQPVPRAGRSSSKALSDAQIDSLTKALDPSDGRQLAALLCLLCGIRKGEAVALRWEDWDGESVHVERADDGKGNDKPPKTSAGVRSVPAPSWIVPVLDGLKKGSDAPMCPDFFGRRLSSNALGTWWHDNRERFGVTCSLHELRHSYLTRLARAGVHPRVMMSLAGHDSMAVCLEIYSHVSDDLQRDAVRNAFG